MKRKYNRIKDKEDIRDHVYKAVHKPDNLPKSVDNRHLFSPIRDQGELGSCTAFSSAGGAFEMLENKYLIDDIPLDKTPEEFGTNFVQVSTLFQYQNTLTIEGCFGQDNGAMIRDAVKSLAVYGACKETTWPYNPANLAVKAPQEAYDEAASHKIIQYARITNEYDLMSAVAQGLPVVVGIILYESFESDEVAKTGIVPIPDRSKESCLGGHAVCIAGYDEHHWIVRNSWGPDWGQKGYFLLPRAYLRDASLAEDFWAITK